MSPAHPQAFESGRLEPACQPRVLSHTQGERAIEREMAKIVSGWGGGTQLAHKLSLWNSGFQVASQTVSGMKLSNHETAAEVSERGRQLLETTLLQRERAVCKRTKRLYETLSNQRIKE